MDDFENLNKKFDVDSFESEVKNVNNQIEKVAERKNEIVESIKNNQVGFTKEDQTFLVDEIKSLIKSTTSVLEKLEQDIRIGTPVRSHEVYAILANSKVNQLKELRDLYRTIMEMAIFDPNSEQNKKEEKNAGVCMTMDQIVNLVKSAQKESSLNAIDAKFEIVDTRDVYVENDQENVFKNKPKEKK